MRRRSRTQRRATSRRSRRSAKRSASPRRGRAGLAPLLADVEQVVQARPSALPAPVRAAAEQVLALRVPLAANLPAPDLKQAFARSGVLFEPRLAAEARAAPQSPHALPAEAATPAPAGDLKAALIVFRQVLKAWANETAPARPHRAAIAAAPLLRLASNRCGRPLPAPGRACAHLASALAGEAEMPPAAPLSPEQATSLAKSVAAALTGREAPAAAVADQPGRSAAALSRRAARRAAAGRRDDRARYAAARDRRAPARRNRGRARAHDLAAGRVIARPARPAARRRDAALDLRGAVRDAAGHSHRAVRGEPRRPRRAARGAYARSGARASRSISSRWGRCMRWSRSPATRASVTLWAERAATATRLNEQCADAERCAARGRARARRLPVPRRGAAGRRRGRPRPAASWIAPHEQACRWRSRCNTTSRPCRCRAWSRRGAAKPARRSCALAREHGVPIEENAPLAEALAQVELGDDIPEALYRAVAEVLVFILRASGKIN